MQWDCLMCPIGHPGTVEEQEWTKQTESVRKDVEGFFGIPKGRFRILKVPILFQKQEQIDNMFITCCILHNIIHGCDGRDEWENDVDWLGVDGRLDLTVNGGQDADIEGGDNGAVANNADAETERGFLARRNALVTHYRFAKAAREIQWLRSETAP
jgi:Plant transposon protein